jgi:hypothetical protein
MKLLLENWRQYQLLTEVQEIQALYESGQITEGERMDWLKRKAKSLGITVGALIALLGAGGVGQSADAGMLDFLRGGAESSQQQEAPAEGLSEDGKSFTAKFQLAGDIQLSMQNADSRALEGAADNGLQGAEITSRMQVGGFFYSTASVN